MVYALSKIFLVRAICPLVFLLSLFSQWSFAQTRSTPSGIGHLEDPWEDRHDVTFQASQYSVLALLGQWPGGLCQAVAVKGNFLFRGNGAMFETLDITNPDSPRVVAQLIIDGLVRDLKVVGNYAYLVAPFTVIDISDPLSPVKLSSINAGGASTKLAVDSPFVYVGFFTGVSIVDVSNPVHPVLRGWNTTSGDIVTGIAVRDPYLYANTNDGFQMDIYDVRNKDSVLWVGGSSVAQPGSPIVISGRYLYANQVTVFDLADPLNPRRVCRAGLPGISAGITVKDSLVFVSMLQQGFAVANVADTLNPTMVGYIDWNGYKGQSFHDVGPYIHSVSNGRAYIASLSGLWTVDLIGDSLSSSSFLPTSYSTVSVAADSSMIYTASGLSGIDIIDYRDRTSPQIAGNIQTTLPALKVVVRNKIVFGLNGDYYNQELIAADVSNPLLPSELAKISFQDTIRFIPLAGSIVLSGPRLYCSFGNARIKIVDMMDSTRPQLIKDLATFGNVAGLALSGQYLYSAEMGNGLRIYDVSNGSNPQFVGSLPIVAQGIEAEGPILVVASDTGLATFDISQPGTPLTLGQVKLPGSRGIVNLATSGNYLYTPISTFYVTDISNPEFPMVVGSLMIGGSSVAANGNLAVHGRSEMGVAVYRNNLITSVNHEESEQPLQFDLIQNYPNPFNPTTTIPFTLKSGCKTTLVIYDLLGHYVKSLINGVELPGRHSAKWDGTDANGGSTPSGIYFCRMSAGGSSVTRKLLLIH